MTPDPIAYRARGNAAEAAYTGATTMTQERRFTAAEMTTEARRMDPDSAAAKMLHQAARDAAIVERLPRTADGVPVVPGSVYYFAWGDGVARGVASVEAVGSDLTAIVSVMSTLHGHTCRVEVLVDNCYSTRAAAEAAAKEAK